jgi:KaiC/GvpD/RAD55 family RecA-like ATPase
MKRRELGSFTVEPLNLSLQATKAGVFILNPQVVYVDDVGVTKTCKPKPVTVTVRPMLHAKIGEETISVPILPDRVTTGFADLDALLYGGIPQNYAVVLTSSPTDEKEQLIKRFLEAGTTAHATTIYLTTEPGSAKAMAKDYPSDFFLFVCNPRADAITETAPNIFKFKGVENLTEIDIALTKVFRTLDSSKPAPKRACIDIASDVLLQHHAVTTRKWLSGVLADLRAKGFTTLVTVNPKMHPAEEVQAILGLFDGEMNISERETAKGLQQVLRIRKLYNQKYLENELILDRERLKQ